MKISLKTVEDYIFNTLGISIKILEWPMYKQLPLYLRNKFAFYQAVMPGVKCLFIFPDDETEQTPAKLKKKINQLQEYWQNQIIYVPNTLTSFNRKRLIEKKIPFIVPRNQIYLPFLGFYLPEYYLSEKKQRNYFRPSTQKLVLYYLLNDFSQNTIPSSLADDLDYSVMTITRAFDELETCDIGATIFDGRQRVFQFHEDKREIWEKTKSRMNTPVRQKQYVDDLDLHIPIVKSGLTALAHYSMLSGPNTEVYAISRSSRKKLNENEFRPYGAYEIQVWSYDPILLANDDIADRFSVYLSLQDSDDERVEAALEEMMEQVKW